LKEIDREVTEVITPRLAALTDPFAWHAANPSRHLSGRSRLFSKRQRFTQSGSREVEGSASSGFNASGNGQVEKVNLNFVQLDEEFKGLQQRKSELAVRRGS